VEKRKPFRIGILLMNDELNKPGLKYLLLSMNRVQSHFEYSVLDYPTSDAVIKALTTGQTVDREKTLKPALVGFRGRYAEWARSEATNLGMVPQETDALVVISCATFSDNFYSTRNDGVSVIALGHWERFMAPPSLAEFIQGLIVRESIARICKPLSGSVHLETRGCICDFTVDLDEARLKILSGYICHSCRTILAEHCSDAVISDLTVLLTKDWLGSLDDPKSVAATLKKLGLDLFHSSGIQPTLRERVVQLLVEESTKEAVKWSFVIALAVFGLSALAD